ncbi:MAG: hypothetical protein AAFP68_01085 [Pseudomonadota bacterium]
MTEIVWVKCPKCGNAVASSSLECPICGTNVKNHIEKAKYEERSNVIGSIFVVLLVALMVWLGSGIIDFFAQIGISPRIFFNGYLTLMAALFVLPFVFLGLVWFGSIEEERAVRLTTLCWVGSISLLFFLIAYFVGVFVIAAFS